MCVCFCVFVCVFCVCVFVCVFLCVCVFVCVCVCVFVCVWCVCVCICVCVCDYVHDYACECVMCVCDPARCHPEHVSQAQSEESYCVPLTLRQCTTTPVRPSCNSATFMRSIGSRCMPMYTALTKLYTLRNRLVIDHLCGPLSSQDILYSWQI